MGFMNGMSTFTKGMGQKAKGNYDIITMNGKISGLQKEIQGIYLEMGQQYYSLYKENPDQGMEGFVNKIRETEGQIEEIKRQIELIKAETASIQLRADAPDENMAGSHGYCAKCGKSLPADASFCIHCGEKLEQPV